MTVSRSSFASQSDFFPDSSLSCPEFSAQCILLLPAGVVIVRASSCGVSCSTRALLGNQPTAIGQLINRLSANLPPPVDDFVSYIDRHERFNSFSARVLSATCVQPSGDPLQPPPPRSRLPVPLTRFHSPPDSRT